MEQNCEKTSGITDKNLVHWFRKGLRLHDQPALVEGKLNFAKESLRI